MKNNEFTLKSKYLKKSGRKTVKTHYLILLLTCLFAGVVGSEFSDALTIFASDLTTIQNFFNIPSSIIQGGQEMLGQTNGVFASIVSGFESGAFINSMISGINSIIKSELVSTVIVIIICLLVVFVFWFFIGNMYAVISRRIFLESRIYSKVSFKRFLFLFYIKKWFKVSKVMFVKSLFNSLWYCVFIVGGIIKRYSYFLVPYIVAENPNISPLEAINLSRKMMNGHKWECFLVEFSFIGWYILRIFTLGISGLFYSNSYEIATLTEFYVQVRSIAKENKIDGVELLNDEFLYTKADKLTISEKYLDVILILDKDKPEINKPSNVLEYVLDFLGITTYKKKLDKKTELELVEYDTARDYRYILDAEQYPNRLFTIPERSKTDKSESSSYMVKYTLPNLILMFFIFCLIGWLWEITLFFIGTGGFVNKGTMHGPWLPIYGSGGILIVTVLYKLRKNVLTQFFAAVVLCGIVEYFTAYFLELANGGTKWWDYSGYFLNLHGRICAEGLLVFGLGGIAVVYLLAPLLDSYISKINRKILLVIVCVLVLAFSVDLIYSRTYPNQGEGITDFDKKTEVKLSSDELQNLKSKIQI